MIAEAEENAVLPAWSIRLGDLAFASQPIQQDADKFRRRVSALRQERRMIMVSEEVELRVLFC